MQRLALIALGFLVAVLMGCAVWLEGVLNRGRAPSVERVREIYGPVCERLGYRLAEVRRWSHGPHVFVEVTVDIPGPCWSAKDRVTAVDQVQTAAEMVDRDLPPRVCVKLRRAAAAA